MHSAINRLIKFGAEFIDQGQATRLCTIHTMSQIQQLLYILFVFSGIF